MRLSSNVLPMLRLDLILLGQTQRLLLPKSKLNSKDKLKRSVNVPNLRPKPVIRLLRRKLQQRMKLLIRKS
jgi:hypothetical protein